VVSTTSQHTLETIALSCPRARKIRVLVGESSSSSAKVHVPPSLLGVVWLDVDCSEEMEDWGDE
jgi:hypothetical protein